MNWELIVKGTQIAGCSHLIATRKGVRAMLGPEEIHLPGPMKMKSACQVFRCFFGACRIVVAGTFQGLPTTAVENRSEAQAA